MKNFRAILSRFAAVFLIATAAAAVSAQSGLPTNSEPWKDRCILLANASAAIQAGKAPAFLTAATRGVPSHGFLVLAVNRAQAGQHYVACTMYYMAALADHAGNGGKVDTVAASNEAIIGGSELKLAHGHHLNMEEHMKRVEFKVEEITGKPLTLTSAETEAVLNASTTMPVSMKP